MQRDSFLHENLGTGKEVKFFNFQLGNLAKVGAFAREETRRLPWPFAPDRFSMRYA